MKKVYPFEIGQRVQLKAPTETLPVSLKQQLRKKGMSIHDTFIIKSFNSSWTRLEGFNDGYHHRLFVPALPTEHLPEDLFNI